jgi:DNA-binding Xre family transcriptional regulator
MDAKGVDQKTVAADTKLSPSTVSKFYRNQIDRFDKKTVETLCKYFECTKLDDLIQLTD